MDILLWTPAVQLYPSILPIRLLIRFLSPMDQRSSSHQFRSRGIARWTADYKRLHGRLRGPKAFELNEDQIGQQLRSTHCGSRQYTLTETFTSLGNRLDPAKFVRVRRGQIVNVTRLTAVHAMLGGTYQIELCSGERISSGRQ